MKKLLLSSLTLFSAFALAACSGQKAAKETTSSSTSTAEPVIVKVASHTSPMTDMLEMITDDLAEAGYTLEIVRVSDNVQANVALHNKEVDANFFQHKPFMEMYNSGNGANLVQIQPIYNANVSFYAKDFDNIENLPEGADVAIPSDPTNMARALRLLATHNIITLDQPDSYTVTVDNITENPKNLTFSPIGLLNLNEAYQEKDMVFNYPTYIAKLGLNPTDNGLILEEESDNTFAVSLVAREDNKDSDAVKAVQKALTSDEIKLFIKDKLAGHAQPAF
ncbi:MetQ/NlpA family ABC transporter substrate-binding protein [Streptococcus entericus]|uniref:MetQ/NlpA family ABC transporter substrate-binding protein n=1 Tax=Streptococcus entericus TaxID=155680 RepID=UPI000380D3E0|nr:MetQ/NlpA family ABC transporter substrate-binding protein [Streptococcus entericus]